MKFWQTMNKRELRAEVWALRQEIAEQQKFMLDLRASLRGCNCGGSIHCG